MIRQRHGRQRPGRIEHRRNFDGRLEIARPRQQHHRRNQSDETDDQDSQHASNHARNYCILVRGAAVMMRGP